MAAPIFVADEVVTATKMNSLPKGVLGHAEVTANQTGITTEADLTSLTVTVDVAASRLIRIRGQVQMRATLGATLGQLRIMESTTQLARANSTDTGGLPQQDATAELVTTEAIITPSAGSHTYKLTALRTAGSGSIVIYAASDAPAFIVCEDIGAA